jgi:hypothetical protein
MRKFFQKILLIAVLVAIPFLIIEIFYRVVPNNYTLKNQNLIRNYRNTEVLIFGNSHAFYGLNPTYFDKPTFNLSNISQTLYFDQLLFDKHIDQFKSLKYIVLTIEYTNLSQQDNSAEDVFRKYYYSAYMDIDVPIINQFDEKVLFLSSTRSFKINVGLIKDYFLNGTIVTSDINGFGTNNLQAKRSIENIQNAKRTVNKHEDHLMDFSKNVDRLASIIEKCKTKNIEVILVTMPVTKQYALEVNQIKLKKIFSTCQTLQNQNDNVRYLNLFNDNRFEDADFFDADHLHDLGAIKSSKIVNDFINDLN